MFSKTVRSTADCSYRKGVRWAGHPMDHPVEHEWARPWPDTDIVDIVSSRSDLLYWAVLAKPFRPVGPTCTTRNRSAPC